MLSHVVKIIYKQEALSIVERVSTRNNCYLGKGTELQKVTKWSYYNPSNISKRAILVHVQIIRTYIIWISETNPTISMKFRMQGVSGSINRSSYSFLGNLIKKYWAKLDNPGTKAIDIVGEVSNRLWYKLELSIAGHWPCNISNWDAKMSFTYNRFTKMCRTKNCDKQVFRKTVLNSSHPYFLTD